MKVEFKVSNSDTEYNLKLDFMLKIAVFYDYENPEHMAMNLSKDELFYDELPFSVELLFINYNDIMYNKILKWGFNFKHGTKHYPHRNSMKMSQSDYNLFLNQFIKELAIDKEILNFKNQGGVKYPYTVPEFHTTLWFDVNAVYFLFT